MAKKYDADFIILGVLGIIIAILIVSMNLIQDQTAFVVAGLPFFMGAALLAIGFKVA